MTPDLILALNQLCAMTNPSVAKILRQDGYDYEAETIERLTRAYEESKC